MKEKSVGFYQVSIQTPQGRSRAVIDWPGHLRNIAALPIRARSHDGVIYDPHVDDGATLLGVHSLIKPDFMTRINDSGSVSDLMDAAESDGIKRFANSTAVAFLAVANAVAIATGTTQSPKPPKVVTDFLTRHIPLGDGEFWVADPIMDTAKIRELREESKGVAEFQGQIITVRDVFQPDESTGLAKFADQVADRIGADVVIDIRVRLAPQSRSRSAMQRMRDTVVELLRRVAGNPGSKAKVKSLLDSGVQEELSLVASRLADTIEIDPKVSESLRFSALLDHLRDVSTKMEDRVRELLEG